MNRAGVGMEAVSQMCHAELAAWLDDILTAAGVKTPADEGLVISRRLPKPQD